MSPLLASVICYCGIAGLFYLDRDRTDQTSKALWLPVFWVGITGSRAVSAWLGMAPTGVNTQMEGSPLDAAIFGFLSLLAIGVLVSRGQRTRALLIKNWPILLYFVYCLISVTWSVHSGIALKRWIKSTGDLAMVLVLVTDRHPVTAIRRLVSRVGFVLLPISILLIKYYPNLGRGYTVDGVMQNAGVANDKNMLGVTLMVISMGTLWEITSLLRDKHRPNRRRHLVAQITLLAFGVSLLHMANSQTSIGCFILGSGIILITGLRAVKKRPARVHILCASILLLGGLTFFLGGAKDIAHAMGRKASLSGRTLIWAALIPATPNPIVGAGYESFWISPNVKKFQETLLREGWYLPQELNEAHDGYLEVYLELGLIGVTLIATILVTGYRRAVAAYRINPSLGRLLLAYIVVSMVYSITEAGFRMLDVIWIFLLLAIVTASGVVSGVLQTESRARPASRQRTSPRAFTDPPDELPAEPVYSMLKNGHA